MTASDYKGLIDGAFLSAIKVKKELIVSITGEIPHCKTAATNKELSTLRNILMANKKMPVSVIISSCGGSSDTASIIVDMLSFHDGAISTIGTVEVKSAATSIFMVGETRSVHAGTCFMIHACSYVTGRMKVSEHERWADYFGKSDVRKFKRLFIATGFLGNKHLKMLKRGDDIELTAKKLIKCGIATQYIKRNGTIVARSK